MSTVTSEVTVTVRVRLDGDEKFEATSSYGLKPRPVLIDTVKAIGGHRKTIVGSGRRVNKNGEEGGLRAAYVPLRWDQLPTEVRVEIDLAYTDVVKATPSFEEWL